MPKQTSIKKFSAQIQLAKQLIEESSYLRIINFENQIKEIETRKPAVQEIPAIKTSLAKLKKLVEAARKEFSEPLSALAKQNNALYKPLTDRIDNHDDFLKEAYRSWIAQEEAKHKVENAERERKAVEERKRQEEENREREKNGKPLIQAVAKIIAPPTPPVQFDKSTARKEIVVEFVDFAKLILAIAKNIKDPAWNEIISGFKTLPIQQIARRNISQETIDMFAAAGVKIKYLPTMEAWGATD